MLRTRLTRSRVVSVAVALVTASLTQLLPTLAGPFAGPVAGLVDTSAVEALVPSAPVASGAVSRRFLQTGPADARRALSIAVGQGFDTNFATLRGSATTFRVGTAGEKRTVTLTVPSRVVRVNAAGQTIWKSDPDILAMTIWKVRCVQSEAYSPRRANIRSDVEPTRWALTARVSGAGKDLLADGSTDWMAALRNVVPGRPHTATVRAVFDFTAPGRYTCFATWGARSPGATDGDRVVMSGTGSVVVSAPLNDATSAVQCFWRDLQRTGSRPSGCLGGALPLDDERLEPLAASTTVNRLRTSVPRPGPNAPTRWMRAEATLRVTTCAGLQGGVSPCRRSDVGTGGLRSLFVGRVSIVQADGTPYPAGCVQLAGPTWRKLGVDTEVHHDELDLSVRFRVRAGCSSDVRVVSSARVAAGAAGWVEQDKSHLAVLPVAG
ncbi:hypothetical protein KIN34_00795 [Cellulomonas sp. DKR-3]|uniref:Uncharacterized protein n=1 Tax=Cellulomonas fulva TaxID=2835530 RepID=A0ABS5TUN6_9CELL|nr:hypothetical protein [Cellulomonas fulva]MBT0992829.1 hypothetical protein [Cellulomonas fulva]